MGLVVSALVGSGVGAGAGLIFGEVAAVAALTGLKVGAGIGAAAGLAGEYGAREFPDWHHGTTRISLPNGIDDDFITSAWLYRSDLTPMDGTVKTLKAILATTTVWERNYRVEHHWVILRVDGPNGRAYFVSVAHDDSGDILVTSHGNLSGAVDAGNLTGGGNVREKYHYSGRRAMREFVSWINAYGPRYHLFYRNCQDLAASLWNFL